MGLFELGGLECKLGKLQVVKMVCNEVFEKIYCHEILFKLQNYFYK